VWVNEEDHLRVISMEKGGNMKEVFRRFCVGLKKVGQSLGGGTGPLEDTRGCGRWGDMEGLGDMDHVGDMGGFGEYGGHQGCWGREGLGGPVGGWGAWRTWGTQWTWVASGTRAQWGRGQWGPSRDAAGHGRT